MITLRQLHAYIGAFISPSVLFLAVTAWPQVLGMRAPPPLKVLFLTVSSGLAASSLIGLWLGLTAGSYRRAMIALVVLGVALPAVLFTWRP